MNEKDLSFEVNGETLEMVFVGGSCSLLEKCCRVTAINNFINRETGFCPALKPNK